MSNKKGLKVKVKKAKNGMLIITAPNGDDYPCKDSEDVFGAISEIVDDESQYSFKDFEPVEAEVVEDEPHRAEQEDGHHQQQDPIPNNFGGGDFTDNLLAEGLSFLLNKAQESSADSAKAYSRFRGKK